MILKIMKYKLSERASDGSHEHESTRLLEGSKIHWFDMETMQGEKFTRFVVDENRPTERDFMVPFEDIDKKLYCVYVLNDSGKTIQKPI